MGDQREGHWRDRPVLAAALRFLATFGPVLAGIASGLALAVLLPAPTTVAAFVLWWVLVVMVSLVAVRATDRAVRRLLPLAALLELSLLFPDQAPSRFKVALTGGSTKHLHDHLAAAQRAGVSGDVNKAAEGIMALVAALGSHHRPSRKHSERVRAYSELIAEELGLPERDIHRLRWASLLHDVGKVAVPHHILEGTGALSSESWDVIQRHPVEGGRLIAPLWDWLGPWAPTVEQHHERYDGGGYPHGLKGDDISLGARIVCVADSFEAMTAKRSYQDPMPIDAARQRVADLAGTQFDPAVVRAFLAVSVRRLRWAYGPAAWVAESPALVAIGNLGHGVAGAGLRGTTALFGAAVAANSFGILPDTAVLGERYERPPAVVTPSPTATVRPGAPPAGSRPPSAPGPDPAPGATTPAPSVATAGTPSTTSTTTAIVTVPTVTIPPVTVTVPPVTVTVTTTAVTVPPLPGATVPSIP